MGEYEFRAIVNKDFEPVKFKPDGKPHYQVFIELVNGKEHDEIKKIEYVLHSSFKNKHRTSSNREGNFRIEILTWGTFEIKITVHKTDGSSGDFTWDMKKNIDHQK